MVPKCLLQELGADKILQYNLTTAFDVTSAALEKVCGNRQRE